MGEWPGGARGALCLSFDNLGEAAEIELGAFPDNASLGEHFTVTRVLPRLLDTLRERDLAATFFVEGLNAELYPDSLAAIDAAGHEVAYHAWRHEQWVELSAAAQADNLARGRAGFAAAGQRAFAGLRPPGGQLGAGGVGALREASLSYCSPAGSGAGCEKGVALLPFQWRHVDATCVLPPLAPVREEISGSPEPLDPVAFLPHLSAEVDRLCERGGFLAVVLHLSLLEWLGDDRLGELLDRLGKASDDGGIWIARCDEVAEHVLAHPDDFRGGATLDPTSWTG